MRRVTRPLLSVNFQTMGWNYWYNWTVVLPAELSAAAVLIDFWDKNTNLNSAWVSMCLVVVVAINFMGAGKSHAGNRNFSFEALRDPLQLT